MSLTGGENGALSGRIQGLPWPGILSAAALSLVVCGAAVRLSHYFFNRSLWLDEAMVAYNLLGRGFAELAPPFEYNQVAPIGFLFLSKAAAVALGPGEMALRLVPLLSGLALLILLLGVVRRVLPPPEALAVLALAAFVPHLVYFSVELKHYSTDAAVTCGLLLLGLKATEPNAGSRWCLLFPGVALAAVWLSHTAPFVIASTCLVMAGVGWLGKRRSLLWSALVTAVLAGSGFLLHYAWFLRAPQAVDHLTRAWKGSFAPFPPLSFSELWWYPSRVRHLFDYPVGLETLLAPALALMGLVWFWKSDRRVFLLLVLPFVFHLSASMFRLYPWGSRVSLYLVPLVLVLIAGGLAFLREAVRPRMRWLVYGVVASFLVIPVSAVTFRDALRPGGKEELRPVLRFVRERIQPGDRIYVFSITRPAYHYYVNYFEELAPLREVETIIGLRSWKGDWRTYQEQLARLNEASRLWLIFSHVSIGTGARDVDDEKLHLFLLEPRGDLLEHTKETGASAYLIDLRGPQVMDPSETVGPSERSLRPHVASTAEQE